MDNQNCGETEDFHFQNLSAQLKLKTLAHHSNNTFPLWFFCKVQLLLASKMITGTIKMLN